jgi:peroxiredoxin Q/BCP
MQAFQDDISRFEKLNAQVLGVSSDTLETHRDFVEKLGLSFPLIADGGDLRKLYGGGRVTYLFDQSGVIRFIHQGMPDNDALLREISNFQSH